MSHEVRSLRTEVRELRGLMQLSFDLQLDIQRAVRQEVAAAISQSLGEPLIPMECFLNTFKKHVEETCLRNMFDPNAYLYCNIKALSEFKSFDKLRNVYLCF